VWKSQSNYPQKICEKVRTGLNGTKRDVRTSDQLSVKTGLRFTRAEKVGHSTTIPSLRATL